MATYQELLTASENPTLNNKVRVACFIAAEMVRNEATAVTNHANRLLWAKAVFENPEQERSRMIWSVLAQNAALTITQILNASDAAVQMAVNAEIDLFANGS